MIRLILDSEQRARKRLSNGFKQLMVKLRNQRALKNRHWPQLHQIFGYRSKYPKNNSLKVQILLICFYSKLIRPLPKSNEPTLIASLVSLSNIINVVIFSNNLLFQITWPWFSDMKKAMSQSKTKISFISYMPQVTQVSLR